MPPRTGVGERRKNQILEAAMAVFARRGFHGTRMDDIVDESGLSKGTLYWYFKSKDDLIAAILDRMFDRSLMDSRRLLQAAKPAPERLWEMNRMVVRDLRHWKPLLPIVYEFYALAARKEAVRISLRRFFKEYRALLAEMIEQGIQTGAFKSVDADQTATNIIAFYEGLMLLLTLDPDEVDWEAQCEAGMKGFLAHLSVGD